MNFKVMRAEPFNTLKLQINNVSCAFWINEEGMSLNGTLNPQSGIDYKNGESGVISINGLDRKYLRVVGVDLSW